MFSQISRYFTGYGTRELASVVIFIVILFCEEFRGNKRVFANLFLTISTYT